MRHVASAWRRAAAGARAFVSMQASTAPAMCLPMLALASVVGAGLAATVAAQATAVVVDASLTLSDAHGAPQRPLEAAPGTLAAVFFVTHDCPISNHYAPEIRRICDAYAARGVACRLVYVDPSLTDAAALAHAGTYALTSSPSPSLSSPTPIIVVDREHRLVRATGVEIAPEVAVITPDRHVAYRGRIDDFFVAWGQSRRQVHTHDLRDALDALLAGRPVRQADAPPVGCIIGDLNIRGIAEGGGFPPRFSHHRLEGKGVEMLTTRVILMMAIVALIVKDEPSAQRLTGGPPARVQTCLGEPATNVVNLGDIFYGTANRDVVVVIGPAQVYTGDGDDLVCVYIDPAHQYAGVGSEIDVGNGHNTVITYGGDNTITAGAGNDLIYLNGGNETVHAGLGNDHIWANGATSAEIYGESGFDLIVGSPGDDLLDGGDHDDVILGNGGDDTILGGPGSDTLFGGPGFDSLDGGYSFGGIDHCIDNTGGATLTECELQTLTPAGPGGITSNP